jgi:tyrosyl-tRNA synthetase
MDIKDKLELIKRNTFEIIGEEDLEKLLKEKEKPVAYIGTAPTGRPHVGYFVWGLKVADLLKAGFHVKVLIADLHAALDNTPWNLLDHRYDYYEKIIPLMIKAMGADITELEFVKGSEIQLSPDYMFDVLKMSSNTSLRDTNRAASEVVKLGDNPKLSGMIYPLMQAVDEEYLKVDVQIGGTDQRKIMVLAREQLEKIGYKPRIELMFPLIPGLIGEKMSSSNKKSKIDLMDDLEVIKSKLNGADCVSGDPNNGILAFLKAVIMVIEGDKNGKFIISRDEKYGGNLEYSTYEEIEKDFIDKKIHPLDLKNAVSEEIFKLLAPIREHKEELEKLSSLGYKDE